MGVVEVILKGKTFINIEKSSNTHVIRFLNANNSDVTLTKGLLKFEGGIDNLDANVEAMVRDICGCEFFTSNLLKEGDVPGGWTRSGSDHPYWTKQDNGVSTYRIFDMKSLSTSITAGFLSSFIDTGRENLPHFEIVVPDGETSQKLNEKLQSEHPNVTATKSNTVVVISGVAPGGQSAFTASRVSHKATSELKFAVASAHVLGGDFSEAQSIASSMSPSDPLVKAVMGLRIGASTREVNSVLDVARSSAHALNEIEHAMSNLGSHADDVLAVYPGAVATRMIDADETGAVTAALQKIF